LSRGVADSSLGLDMFRNFNQTGGGILPKLGYEHKHKYSLNHKQSVHVYVHTARDGGLMLY